MSSHLLQLDVNCCEQGNALIEFLG